MWRIGYADSATLNRFLSEALRWRSRCSWSDTMATSCGRTKSTVSGLSRPEIEIRVQPYLAVSGRTLLSLTVRVCSLWPERALSDRTRPGLTILGRIGPDWAKSDRTGLGRTRPGEIRPYGYVWVLIKG